MYAYVRQSLSDHQYRLLQFDHKNRVAHDKQLVKIRMARLPGNCPSKSLPSIFSKISKKTASSLARFISHSTLQYSNLLVPNNSVNSVLCFCLPGYKHMRNDFSAVEVREFLPDLPPRFPTRSSRAPETPVGFGMRTHGPATASPEPQDVAGYLYSESKYSKSSTYYIGLYRYSNLT